MENIVLDFLYNAAQPLPAKIVAMNTGLSKNEVYTTALLPLIRKGHVNVIITRRPILYFPVPVLECVVCLDTFTEQPGPCCFNCHKLTCPSCRRNWHKSTCPHCLQGYSKPSRMLCDQPRSYVDSRGVIVTVWQPIPPLSG